MKTSSRHKRAFDKYMEANNNANHSGRIKNVNLSGGLIGLIWDSPTRKLNKTISAANSEGWRVVQVLPASEWNLLVAVARIIVLVVTIFLYTFSNGYYLLLEKVHEEGLDVARNDELPSA